MNFDITLETSRLLLRPFRDSDAGTVQRHVGDRDIADTVTSIPHPYPDGAAEQWISGHAAQFNTNGSLRLAITAKPEDSVIGSIGLDIDPIESRGTIGYWVAKEHWNKGICTEAATAVLAYAFATAKLDSVSARHFSRNPASGRVLEKIGMRHVETQPKAIEKWGVLEDVEVYEMRSTGSPSREQPTL